WDLEPHEGRHQRADGQHDRRRARRAPRSAGHVRLREDRAHEVAAGMRTEVPFTLPQGYADAAGTVHREGIMRLATARDEIEPLRDVAVRTNGAYLSVLLLARTVTRLGDLQADQLTPDLI